MATSVAVITGASQGIGAALVKAYRGIGYSVVANSRTIGPSDDPEVLTVQGDVGDPAVGARLIESAIDRFGRIDTLVNNAGVFIAKPFTMYDADDYAALVGTNLGGYFGTTQKAVEKMLAQGSGHIVSITTTLVENADSNVPSVLTSLTKGGIDAATRSLAIELATTGVRVNAVSPGIIKTPMHAPEAFDAYASLHPMKRMGTVEDIARGVIYLEQSDFVTGETLHIDGGQSAGR